MCDLQVLNATIRTTVQELTHQVHLTMEEKRKSLTNTTALKPSNQLELRQ